MPAPGCTIGTTMTISGKAIPNLVGVDIGCGMETILLKEKHIDCKSLTNLSMKKFRQDSIFVTRLTDTAKK